MDVCTHVLFAQRIVLQVALLFSVVHTYDYSGLIESVADYIGVKAVLLIHHQDENFHEVISAQRALNGLLKFYTTVANFQELQANTPLPGGGKALIVVYSSLDTQRSFVSVSKSLELHRVNWLWLSSSTEPDVTIFRDVYIPFHANFLYTFRKDEDVVLQEVYQKSKDLPTEVINFGVWRREDGLKAAGGEFYNRRRDLNGLRLKYLLKDGFGKYRICSRYRTVGDKDLYNCAASPPFLPCTCDLSFDHNPTVLECLNWRIWKDFEVTFNFTSEYMANTEISTMAHSSTVMRKIENHEIDGGSWSFILTSRRLEQNHFMWPIVPTDFFIYTKVPDVEINFSSYLQPLSLNLWSAVIAWMLTTGVAMTFTKWIIVRLLTRRDFLFLRDAVDDSSTCFSALCSQSASLKTGEDMLTTRIFIITSYAVSLFLLPAYSGGLISSLGNPPSRVPFTNIDEFEENGHYKIITLKNSFVHSFLETEKIFETIRKEKLTWPVKDMPTGDVQAFNLICENRLSYFIDQPVFLKDRPRCKLFTMNQLFGSFSLSMAVAKDFPFTELFKRILQRRLTCGVSAKDLEKIVLTGLGIDLELRTQKSSKGVFQEMQFEHTKAFTLTDVLSIFLVFSGGLMLSGVVLLIELRYIFLK